MTICTVSRLSTSAGGKLSLIPTLKTLEDLVSLSADAPVIGASPNLLQRRVPGAVGPFRKGEARATLHRRGGRRIFGGG
eukprot:4910534-Prymnesium_polylepis.1